MIAYSRIKLFPPDPVSLLLLLVSSGGGCSSYSSLLLLEMGVYSHPIGPQYLPT